MEPPLESGGLWSQVQERARGALETGALLPLETRSKVLPEAGIPFAIQYASTLREKHARDGEASESPFLPPDPDLTVAEISPTHLAVLNRYPVIHHHLLVVTKEYEDQSLPLGAGDFDALARCLAEIDGLGFYNAGSEAGASQDHRHLQVVPFPVGPGPAPTPVEGTVAAVVEDPSRATLPAFPFRHAVMPLPQTAWQGDDPDLRARRTAEAMRLAYRALAARTGVRLAAGRPTDPYNLLATRRWMLLVPRRREGFEGVSINALGFAGSILIRNKAQWEAVQRIGPIGVLRQVAVE
jgi:sulfate adenylyltransferase (ADP) / ATP adenylyltransferase